MIRKHADAIGHALDGLGWAVHSQTNYRVHFLLIICSLCAAYWLSISFIEWLILWVVIICGLVVETINTALEQLGDAITHEYDIHIKRAKDVSAGAMLIYAIGATCIAAFIFLPRLISLIVVP